MIMRASFARTAKSNAPAGRTSIVARAALNPSATWKDYKPDMRKLGSSDLMVPDICLGTMTWGQQNTEAEAHEQLSFALDCGINFIDAAEIYPVPTKAETQGKTEEYIGTWLKTQKREDIILATKVCGYSPNLTYMRKDGSATRVRAPQIKEAIEGSLRRLQTDYVDLYQIHWPDRYVTLFGQDGWDPVNFRDDAIPFEEQLQALDELVKEGKVRYIGVSNETSYGVMEMCNIAEAKGLPKIVSIQNQYHLLARSKWETDLAEVCYEKNKNVGLLAYSPLAGGMLSGKYQGGSAPEGARFTLFPGYMERYTKSPTKAAVARYMEVAEKYGLTSTQLALAWCQQQWHVTSSIIGATSMNQLKEDIAAFAVGELPDELLDDIDAVYREVREPTLMSKTRVEKKKEAAQKAAEKVAA